MSCNHVKKCIDMKVENEIMRNGLMELCIKHADKHYGGNFSITKNETNWKLCFGTSTGFDELN